MAALNCDLCGGKLIMGAGGIATCESCGMEHSTDRMKEKVQEIKGTVRVDNTHMVDNYLSMAQNAYESKNNEEAESYCNKIIEIDTTNYKAWFLKGKAAGWQSTLQNPRFSESVSAFSKAIQNAPEEERENVIEDSKEEIKDLSSALIALRAKRFAEWPDDKEKQGFISDLKSILHVISEFLIKAKVMIPVGEIMGPAAKQINSAVVKAWQKIEKDYHGKEGKPNQYEWERFIKRVDYCLEILDVAISICKDDDEADIQRYENMIFLQKEAINSCSWDYDFTYGIKSYHVDYTLTDQAKAIRRQRINKYQEEIDKIKQKANDKYWNEHPEEKKELDDEIKVATEEIQKLNQEVQEITNSKERAELMNKRYELKNQKAALGIFNKKEKNQIQEQIDEIESEVEMIDAEIEQKVAKLESRISILNKKVERTQEKLKNPTK